MKGTAYGVGVGPGDPELMTLKAVRLIRENNVIAVPGNTPQDSLAYKIAVQSVPELANKTILPISMPMTKDKNILSAEHNKGAADIEKHLDMGENVVYLTLGDPTVYSSFGYLKRSMEDDGYTVELVSGVTSFCAAAARMNITLAEQDEEFYVLPRFSDNISRIKKQGTYVFMKSGKYLSKVKNAFDAHDFKAYAAENCGFNTEKIYIGNDEIPDNSGYFTITIVKNK